MRTLVATLVMAMILVGGGQAWAGKKKAAKPDLRAPKQSAKPDVRASKPPEDRNPPPGDKSTNEGAQGRMNATEDAARAADSPQFEHRP